MSVSLVLVNNAAGLGLGLGLFGVLSIIRLRSSELSQEEVAYYFVALALGLLAGVQPDPAWIAPVLGTVLVATMYVADHPRLLSRYRRQVVTLDAAYTDERELTRRLEELLGAEVRQVVVTQVDLVRDLTIVDVRYRLLAASPHPRARRRSPRGAGVTSLALAALLARRSGRCRR